MSEQLDIFGQAKKREFDVHKKENNTESQETLDTHREDWKEQCRIVFDFLMEGNTVTRREAMIGIYVDEEVHSIGDSTRRIHDLRAYGVKIDDEVIENSKGAKRWLMTQEQREYNARFKTEITK